MLSSSALGVWDRAPVGADLPLSELFMLDDSPGACGAREAGLGKFSRTLEEAFRVSSLLAHHNSMGSLRMLFPRTSNTRSSVRQPNSTGSSPTELCAMLKCSSRLRFPILLGKDTK